MSKLVLTTLQFIEGVLKIANIFLIIVAAFIAFSMFKAAGKTKELKTWRILIVVLGLLTLQEIFGALRAFAIYETNVITRLIPTAMLGLLIWALVLNIMMIQKKRAKR